jgi:hypothetical protein
MKNDWGKYIIAFFITASLFAIAAGLSNFFSDKKIDNMRSIQDKIATDILSSETQFSLLSELSCVQDEESNNFSYELNELADKINFAEQNMKNSEEVIELKRYYSLLEIKDFLLTKKINEKCDGKLVPILYFYTTADTCTECVKQSLVLTELRQKYSNIRVYSFDYNLNLSALKALIKIYKIEDTKLPAIIVNEYKATGFKTIEDIENLKPEIKDLLLENSPEDNQETEETNN